MVQATDRREAMSSSASWATPYGTSWDWRWAEQDEHGVWTGLAVATTVAAGLMALFGLPPVNLHGPLHFVGIMDPLCGMTRALRLLALGHWARAITYNPASPLVVVAAIVLVVRDRRACERTLARRHLASSSRAADARHRRGRAPMGPPTRKRRATHADQLRWDASCHRS